MADQLVDIVVRHNKAEIDKFAANVDPDNTDDLDRVFRTAIERDPKHDRRSATEYEILIRDHKTGRTILSSYVGKG